MFVCEFFFSSAIHKNIQDCAIAHHIVISTNVSKFSEFLKHLAEKCIQ